MIGLPVQASNLDEAYNISYQKWSNLPRYSVECEGVYYGEAFDIEDIINEGFFVS